MLPQVIPVDSQGEALLIGLHSPLSMSAASHLTGSLISFDEVDDSGCLHSSTEDLGKKVNIYILVVEPNFILIYFPIRSDPLTRSLPEVFIALNMASQISKPLCELCSGGSREWWSPLHPCLKRRPSPLLWLCRCLVTAP